MPIKIVSCKFARLIHENEKNIYWGLFWVLILFRIWLVTGVPKMFIYGPHDDLFYVRAAQALIRGQWLGAYDEFTLIKGPFYALFLIGSFLTGLPLYLTESLFYILACIVLFIAIRPLIRNRWWRLFLFMTVLFIPSSFYTWFHLRVYREFVYYSLTLFVTAFAIGLFLRTKAPSQKIMPWSIGLGLSMGAFLLTREEGIWIYPVLILILLINVLLVVKGNENQKVTRSFLHLLPIAIWYIPIMLVSYLNYVHYGYWGITEQLDVDFNRVMNTLARIETDTWHPAIRVSQDARMAAYQASPTLRGYQDMIERYVLGWKPTNDDNMRLKPDWYLAQFGDGGQEIGNGHFSWLLRDIPAHSGLYREGIYPRYFYQQIGDELEKACDVGELNCRPKSILPAMVGSIDRRHLPIIVRMFGENFVRVIRQDLITISSLNVKSDYRSWPSGNDEYWAFEQFAYNPVETVNTIADDDLPKVIYGVTDLRFRIIIHKQNLVGLILNVYQRIYFLLFIIAVFTLVIFIVQILNKKAIKDWLNYVIVSLFIMGLFLTRLMTLSIIDATSSIPAMHYGASMLIFPPIFTMVMLGGGMDYIKREIGK
jgi:hypothetical protein